MKHILIIGKKSYIGNSFKDYMDERHADEDWHVDFIGSSNGDWETWDFSNYDVILHVGAIVHQKERKVGEETYRTVNYEMPVKAARKAEKHGVLQFIFLSTMAVYGDVEGEITEKTNLNPTTFYGKYKRMAEIELLCQDSQAFKVAVIRPPMVYGKGCRGNFARLLKLSKYLGVFPKIKNKRSMIYIDNLCEYIYLTIKCEASGVGCPQNETWVETSDLYYRIRKGNHKKTFMTKLGNGIIFLLMRNGNVFDKLFGNCYYDIKQDKDGWIPIGTKEYQAFEYAESIEQSI
ncbi:MAG: NAD-dependent epimerase/dehydratase family protein [Velocimicrobium sp.]